MDQAMQGQSCRCPHHKAVPFLMFLFGLMFLLNAYDVVTVRFVQVGWPILVILASFMKMSRGMCKCCAK